MQFHSLGAARRGLSLTEVLIAIFVMAIGMISLLVLFPVGMVNTRWAIQNNRVAVAANNANAMAELSHYDNATGQTFSLRTDPAYRSSLQWATDDTGQPVFWNLLATTVDSLGNLLDPLNILQPNHWTYDTAGPAPVVYVDPIGATQWPSTVPTPPYGTTLLGLGVGHSDGGNGPINFNLRRTLQLNLGPVLGNVRSHGVPRVRSMTMTTALEARTGCVLPDDIAFDEFGRGTRPLEPNRPAIPYVQREKRYSWAYMCRWPQANDPAIVDMSIVVYGGRPLQDVLGNNTLSSPNERRYYGVPGPFAGLPRNRRIFLRGSNEAVIFSSTPTGAPIRRGDWILDNTLIMPTQATNALGTVRYCAPFANELKVVPMRDLIPAIRLPLFDVTLPGINLGFNLNTNLRTGIANGHFYQVVSVSQVQFMAGVGYVQTIILNRPALADGYEMVHMPNVIEVIEKNIGNMPAR